MQERLSIIYSRRSVRSYTSEPVDQDDIHELMEAAMAAPSANNSKPLHFLLIEDRATLKALSAVHPYGKMLEKAPLGIAVCGDPSISNWWVQDCSAATENLLIAAAGLGLGAVWLGVHGRSEREEEIRDMLHVPKKLGILCLVAAGHPVNTSEARTQFDDSRIHRSGW